MQVIYNASKFAILGLTESLKYEYAEKGLHFSVICPGDIATPIFGKVTDNKGRGTEVPGDAYPADKAASDVLDGVAEFKGRILVPDIEANRLIVGGYCLGDKGVDDFLLKHAHDHRLLFETEGRFA